MARQAQMYLVPVSEHTSLHAKHRDGPHLPPLRSRHTCATPRQQIYKCVPHWASARTKGTNLGVHSPDAWSRNMKLFRGLAVGYSTPHRVKVPSYCETGKQPFSCVFRLKGRHPRWLGSFLGSEDLLALFLPFLKPLDFDESPF